MLRLTGLHDGSSAAVIRIYWTFITLVWTFTATFAIALGNVLDGDPQIVSRLVYGERDIPALDVAIGNEAFEQHIVAWSQPLDHHHAVVAARAAVVRTARHEILPAALEDFPRMEATVQPRSAMLVDLARSRWRRLEHR